MILIFVYLKLVFDSFRWLIRSIDAFEPLPTAKSYNAYPLVTGEVGQTTSGAVSSPASICFFETSNIQVQGEYFDLSLTDKAAQHQEIGHPVKMK